jgi:flagellar motor protein MotB
MQRANRSTPSSRTDWLPWALSIFAAGCAAFVLIRGVLPARATNAALVQRVERLETAARRATDERASLSHAKEQLAEQYASAQAQLTDVVHAEERQRQTREAAQRELSQALAPAIAKGDLALGTRRDELVLELREDLLFHAGHSDVAWTGRQFLRNLGEVLRRLPATQVYQIRGYASGDGSSAERKNTWKLSATRAANVARYLESDGKVAGPQLVAVGFAHGPNEPLTGAAAAPSSIEIVLLRATL